MVTKHRINNLHTWRRAKTVSFKGGTVSWTLRVEPYDLLQAYSEAPHREFVAATDDASLKAFILGWGPFDIATHSGSDKIERLRSIQRAFAWSARLRDSIGNVSQQRAVLASYNPEVAHGEALIDTWSTDAELAPGVPLEKGEVPKQWFEIATPEAISDACAYLVSDLMPNVFPTYDVAEVNGKRTVVASIFRYGLREAMHWMMWQDLMSGQPMQFCEECSRVIVADSRHARRFCSPACSTRLHTREWTRKKREEARITNGTH